MPDRLDRAEHRLSKSRVRYHFPRHFIVAQISAPASSASPSYALPRPRFCQRLWALLLKHPRDRAVLAEVPPFFEQVTDLGHCAGALIIRLRFKKTATPPGT